MEVYLFWIWLFSLLRVGRPFLNVRPHNFIAVAINAKLGLTFTSDEQRTATVPTLTVKSPTTLTQREYLIAVRNRLFSVEEQIWLHEYAKSRISPKVDALSDSKYAELLRAREELLEEYPLTKLHSDLKDAQHRNLTYAALYLERLITNFNRQMPVSMDHVNQIAVLSSSGQVINLMRGQGAVSHRLLPSGISTDSGVKRQYQHPAFSPSGKYVAFAELQFKTDGVSDIASIPPNTAAGKSTSIPSSSSACELVKSEAVVFEVPRDPRTYGATDSMPRFTSGELPGAPFFVRFSPDEESLVMLCTPTDSDGGSSSSIGDTALVAMEWGKYTRKGTSTGTSTSTGKSKGKPPTASKLHIAHKSRTLMTGNPLFFAYTTSNSKNATIVAHCQQGSNKAVWMLQRRPVTDTTTGTTGTTGTTREGECAGDGGEESAEWVKVCDSESNSGESGGEQQRWSTPACHSAGGGDNVLVVEDGWLTTRALSRWKRNADGSLKSKRLRQVKGQVQFLVSPDGSKAVVLEEDTNVGHYALTVIEGEGALDPANEASTGARQYELPNPRLTVAFWFSPDSTKVLCLTVADMPRGQVSSLKSSFRVGLNAEMQWSVYNFPLQELRHYDTFKPTPYFMKTYVPFFSQYAQAFNPWAPDSRSFLYLTSAGMTHTPLVGSKHCLGEDRWQNQGATFGTWSRQ